MLSLQSVHARPEFSPLSLARMLWKSKFFAGAVWLSLSAAACTVVYLLPATYKAETLILVDSQKIPEKYVSPAVNADVQDRLATINQRILSGTRLKKILDDFQLYRDERRWLVEEEILEKMRSDIEVKIERGWSGNRPGAFRIAYKARVPSLAAEVANRLASLYIEENLRTREIQAEGTSEFLDSQVQEAKKRLDGLEKAVSRYKVQHNGELPEQEPALAGTLARLHTELQGVHDAINRAQQNHVLLGHTLGMAEAAEAALAPAPPAAAPGTERPQKAPLRSELLQAQLDALRARYSDEYPDVKRAAADLAAVRAQEQAQAPPENPRPAPSADAPERIQARQRTAAVRAQIALLDRELASRTADRERILQQIAVEQGHLQRLPVREQEMAALTRDYEISKANYKSLLDKKLSAEMATEMERRQKAERFTVLDSARVPEKPYRPNRVLLDTVSCIAALAVAVAAALGMELRKGLVLGEWELPAQLIVLGRVPPFGPAEPRIGRFGKRRRESVWDEAGKAAS